MAHHDIGPARRTNPLPWFLWGALFAVSAVVLVISLAATPSPGLPPERLPLFHNETAAWLAAAGLVASLAGALLTLIVIRSRTASDTRAAAYRVDELEEQVRDMETQLERRNQLLQEANAAYEEARRRLEAHERAEADLRARNEEFEQTRREGELRTRELELKIGQLELERERERQKHLQGA
jgi:TolA-binding protein